MKQIRLGVFETNSSSTHSLTLCSSEDYERWGKGELLFDKYSGKFFETSPVKVKDTKPEIPEDEDDEENDGALYTEDGDELYTRDSFWDGIGMETFHEEYVTKSGEKVVAFGYWDG